MHGGLKLSFKSGKFYFSIKNLVSLFIFIFLVHNIISNISNKSFQKLDFYQNIGDENDDARFWHLLKSP